MFSMNFFHFKLNITRKGSKILYSFALFFIIFFSFVLFPTPKKKPRKKLSLLKEN